MTSARIAFLMEGSRGDTQPYIVLAKELVKSGHTVRYFTNANHVDFVSSHGVDVRGCGADVELFLREDEDAKDAMKTGDFFKYIKCLDSERARADFRKSVKPYWDGLDEFEPEVLLHGPLTHGLALFYQYARNVPAVKCELQPGLATREWAPFGLPTFPAWTGLNAVVWKLILASLHGTLGAKKSIVQDVMKIDLGHCLSKQWTVEKWMCTAPHIQPTIIGISPSFRKPAANWPTESVTTVGWWVEDKEAQAEKVKSGDKMYGGEDSLRLADFLKAGAPPVYMGWGSMIAVSTEYLTCLAVRALKGAGQRGIILGGWAQLSIDGLAGAADEEDLRAYCKDNVLFMKTAPHAWLFPQCACAVHHGGSGTTAASVLAGIPTVITPVFLDQWDYAAILNKEGCGVGTAKGLSKVTTEELVAAIKKCCTDETVKERARAMGKACSADDGKGMAVKIITDFYKSKVKTGEWHDQYKKEASLYQPKPSMFCCASA